jgi:predicted nucleotidyltransferase
MRLILKRLNDHGVEYVLVGGLAAVVHGSSLVTYDVDVCVSFREPNLSKIFDTLREINPRIRMRPDKMRLPDDPARFTSLKNLYLDTDLGSIDFLGELTGVGGFEEVMKHSKVTDFGAFECRVLDLETLIIAKRAAGRPKDIRALPELEALKRDLTLFDPDQE